MASCVRCPTLGDVDDLARINIAAWRDAYTGLVPQSRIDAMDLSAYRQRWSDRIRTLRPEEAIFVAEVDGVVASYASGGPYRPQEDSAPEVTGELGELYAIYVDPPMQGRGAGTAVHDALLRWLARHGYTEAALWVLEVNAPSRAWYARRGWRPDGATSLWTADGQALRELRLRRAPSRGG